MLASDPPPGTQVRFVRAFRNAQAGDMGTIVKSMRDRVRVELPNDSFIIQFRDEVFMVDRRDIELAYPASGGE